MVAEQVVVKVKHWAEGGQRAHCLPFVEQRGPSLDLVLGPDFSSYHNGKLYTI